MRRVVKGIGFAAGAFVLTALLTMVFPCSVKAETPEDGQNLMNTETGQNTEGEGTGQNAEGAGTGQNLEGAGAGQNAEGAGTGQNAKGAGTGQNAEGAGLGQNTQEAGAGQNAQEAGAGQNAQEAGAGQNEQDVQEAGAGQNTDILNPEQQSLRSALGAPNDAAAIYTLDGKLMEGYPGVYVVAAVEGANRETDTIGVSSVAKQTLADHPTTESPAIITGAAVNYETKTGPTEFTPIEGAELLAPYSYFRWSLLEEQMQEADGSTSTHTKTSGFDGTYYIIRVDMTDYLNSAEGTSAGTEGETATGAWSSLENKYLHVKQDGNKALMVASGIENTTFSDALGNKTGSYSLKNSASALLDTVGPYQDIPFFDVVVMASGKLVAGADAGGANAPSADFGLSFYIDETEDYNPELKYDPASTDPNHAAEVLKKFYRDENATADNHASSYLVKGSDFEIDVMVDESETSDGVAEYWSLPNAMAFQPYDSHTVKLISEVPVLEGLEVSGTEGQERVVELDVNSFDIQIANNNTTGAAGLVVSDNATLILKDSTSTAGAELAIGNNAKMVIKNGGTLFVDQSCVFEVEYDAATITGEQTAPANPLTNGEIIIENGGRLINEGVVNIEGTEGKPLQPNAQEQSQQETVTTDMRGAVMIVQSGGEFINNGALSLKGKLYVLGTLENNGTYNDTIVKTDPDKGQTAYHKGIQITWKDDVTKEGVVPGSLEGGIDADGNIYRDAKILNSGDIVVVPGTINLYGILDNQNGKVYLADVTEAIIPITPTAEAPLVVEKRITLDTPQYGLLVVDPDAVILGNDSNFSGAVVALIHNGVLGDLTPTGDAKNYETLLKAGDYVLLASDGTGALTQGVDFTVNDGSVEFLPEYLASFEGKRTVRVNIGYRFLEYEVTGTKVPEKQEERVAPAVRVPEKAAAPKAAPAPAANTGDAGHADFWMMMMLAALLTAAAAGMLSRKKENVK